MPRFIAPFAAALLLAAPLAAQEDDAPSLMRRGAQMFLEGLLEEMGPALQGMQAFVDRMGPALRDLVEEVEDWSVYEPPEVLPNGDIIIRRKPPADRAPADAPAPGDEIDI